LHCGQRTIEAMQRRYGDRKLFCPAQTEV
jgi:hypothetical protein